MSPLTNNLPAADRARVTASGDDTILGISPSDPGDHRHASVSAGRGET
jgi:hypothetical protein